MVNAVEKRNQGKDLSEVTGMVEEMTNKQLQFITWLITTATDKCQTIDEVRELNREIRKHSDGLIDDIVSGSSTNEKPEA
ncbi:hypothetical protein [Eubacterium sp. MSJ-33]|uniref:hypothetical protein n=1 Tax=Eubacterium sp. MSJ-33 TaxID=2841528 RepID=UPI001C76C079|nr:hypothetical protein [Eubacterium sp. MSJ-33]QWT52040.1 hypothetical protein KP625_07990 [Eubacterium sp. MSJ-33]